MVTPALSLLLGVDMRYAIETSLVSVVATSSGAACEIASETLTRVGPRHLHLADASVHFLRETQRN